MAFDRFWSANEPVPGEPADNYQPALAILGDAIHLIWSSNRVLYHAVRSANAWSSPVRIAAGEQPSIAASPDGQLHCIFSNPFVGNWEIYHIAFEGGHWSLPKPVSRTSGVSVQPALVAAWNGSLHAVWADSTPGESVVYHGTLGAGAMWSSAPIPSGRGCLPCIAATRDGDILVAWQDRIGSTGTFDVFCSMLRDDKWSLPDMVSDTAATHSVRPCLAATPQGEVHLVWLEEDPSLYAVRHSDRRVNGWSQPVAVSTGSQDCRQARIVTNPQSFLQVVWLEGNALHHRVRPPGHDMPWWVPQTAEGLYRELSDLSAAVDQTGKLHLVWSGFADGGNRSLFYAFREPIFKPAHPK